MSRWLWALLGGVVLVAIAALFWTTSNQTNVTPPVSSGPTPVAPAPAPAPTAQNVAPSPPPSPPAAQDAATPPAPVWLRRPLRLRPPMQDSKRPRRLLPRRPPRRPRLHPSSRRSLRPRLLPAPLADAPLPPPAPGREAQEVAGIYAPKSLAQLVGTWAYSAADCERLFQRRGGGWAYRQPVDKFAQAAIVEFAEEDRSAFRHLSDRWRVSSGRRAQGERRLPGLD